MKNTTELFNKEFADRFITDNYTKLSVKFRVIDCRISEKGISSLDKLNDTCLILYRLGVEYDCYTQFCEVANRKFKICIDDMKKKKCKTDNEKKSEVEEE